MLGSEATHEGASQTSRHGHCQPPTPSTTTTASSSSSSVDVGDIVRTYLTPRVATELRPFSSRFLSPNGSSALSGDNLAPLLHATTDDWRLGLADHHVVTSSTSRYVVVASLLPVHSHRRRRRRTSRRPFLLISDGDSYRRERRISGSVIQLHESMATLLDTTV